MLALASTVAIPVWLAPVLVGINAIGSIGTAVGIIINDLVQWQRWRTAERQRAQLEQQQAQQKAAQEQQRHQELLAAISSTSRPAR